MKKGFTLIELIVVIAIIGLLAAIVLASLTAASNTAHDNSVKAGLRELSTQIQSDATSGNFGAGLTLPWGVSSAGSPYCSPWLIPVNDIRIQQILTNIYQNSATSNPGFHCSVDSTGTKWAVSVSVLRGTSGPWCIDNSGGFRNTSVNVVTPIGMCP
jgi:prepilin-type N-terminal cleavage/methylation domain-containing protein